MGIGKNHLLNLRAKRFDYKRLRRAKITKLKAKANLRPTLSSYQRRAISLRYSTELLKFTAKSFTNKIAFDERVFVPEILSFSDNFDLTFGFFSELNGLFLQFNTVSTVDFSRCKKMKIGAITFFQVLIREFARLNDRLKSNCYSESNHSLRIVNSKELKINKILMSLGLITDFEGIDEVKDSAYLSLNIITGTKARSSFKENIKGRIANNVVKFVNDSMKGIEYELSANGKRLMLKMMGEILGNAEDHSKLNQFYVNGVTYIESEHKDIVELNLAIINLGYSIYEGLIHTKNENSVVFNEIESQYGIMQTQIPVNSKNYNRESMFTFYALQEGISRLKYEDESRGNGTMNFIDCFMSLGKSTSNGNYKSELNIITGHTIVTCTEDLKPFRIESGFVLPLNRAKDTGKLPDETALKLSENYFPGTILQAKIYMDKTIFEELAHE